MSSRRHFHGCRLRSGGCRLNRTQGGNCRGGVHRLAIRATVSARATRLCSVRSHQEQSDNQKGNPFHFNQLHHRKTQTKTARTHVPHMTRLLLCVNEKAHRPRWRRLNQTGARHHRTRRCRRWKKTKTSSRDDAVTRVPAPRSNATGNYQAGVGRRGSRSQPWAAKGG